VEKKCIALAKQILTMAENRDEEQQQQNDGFYRLPDEMDRKQSKAHQNETLLTSCYVEPKHKKTEQELWEESQTQKAAALTVKKKREVDVKEEKYDLVFEDQIAFVMQDTHQGYDCRKKEHIVKQENEEAELDKVKATAIQKALMEHEKILEGHKNFQYILTVTSFWPQSEIIKS